MNKQDPSFINSPAYRHALEKTAPGSDFSAEALRRELEATVSDETHPATPDRYLDKTTTDTEGLGATDTAEITDFRRATAFPDELLQASSHDKRRFELAGIVGKGATARIYAMRDNSLNRTIAVKFLKRSKDEKANVKQRFIHEARVTAMLEHPNIMPVYDIGATEKNQIFFSMKNVSGCSLGDAIRRKQRNEEAPSEFRTADGIVRIFLKICDALEYAHHRGFVHQDIKPDNIMLGGFGEVLLLDWGSALSRLEADSIEHKGLFGTPAYMSPEQARRERADQRSDVYCLGATLFHALTLRHPTWADTPEVFWEKKRKGVVDEPTEQERRNIPKALLGIALKALSFDPAQRYATVSELSEDLKRYQAGRAVSAHRESTIEILLRWYRHNRRVFWVSSAAALLVLGTGALLLREKVKEWITWRLVYSEDFGGITTENLKTHWRAYYSRNWLTLEPDTLWDSTAWHVSGKALASAAEHPLYNLAYRHPIPGDIRVEWDVTSLARPGDINCFIAGETRRRGYTFHIGGFGDSRSCILTKGTDIHPIDQKIRTKRIRVGTTYHLRMEKEGKHIRLFIDGHKVIDHADPDVLSGIGHQTFGFESNNRNRLLIDNIRIYHHPLPLKVSPLATPDRFYEEGHIAEALRQYRGIRRTYPHHKVAAEAQFKAARCLLRLDSIAPAADAYRRFEEQNHAHDLVPLSMYEHSKILRETGHVAEAEELYRKIAKRFHGHPVLRSIVFDITAERVTRLQAIRKEMGRDSAVDAADLAWIDRERRTIQHWCEFLGVAPERNVFLDAAAGFLMLSRIGLPYDTVAQRFPAQDVRLATQLRMVGGVQRLISDFPHCEAQIVRALQDAGCHERIVNDYPHNSWACALSLLELGRFQEVLIRFPQQRPSCASALIALERYDDVLEKYAGVATAHAEALWRSGRAEECLRRHPQTSAARLAALHLGRFPEYLQTNAVQLDDAIISIIKDMHKPDSALRLLIAAKNSIDGIYPDGVYPYRVAECLRETNRLHEIDRYVPHPLVQARALCWQGDSREAAHRFGRNTVALAQIYRAMGAYDSILVSFPWMKESCATAMLLAGRFAELLKRLPLRRRDCARALLQAREYERIPREYPDQRRQCARALVKRGEYKRVLAEYPDLRTECYYALRGMGRSDEAWQRYPEHRTQHARYLWEQQRFADLVELFADRTTEYSLALLELGRHGDIPFDDATYILDRKGTHELYSVWGLRAYANGRLRRADSLFSLRPEMYISRDVYHLRFSEYLMVPCVGALTGRRSTLQQACREIRKEHPYRYAQQLWYEAGYLMGETADEQFLSQPHGLGVSDRLVFYRAIRDDLAGRAQKALRSYRNCPPVTGIRDEELSTGVFDSYATQEFIRWRIEALRGSLAEKH